MTASLFSAQWYRVARLRPRLRAQVRVQRQQWREQRWYLVRRDCFDLAGSGIVAFTLEHGAHLTRLASARSVVRSTTWRVPAS